MTALVVAIVVASMVTAGVSAVVAVIALQKARTATRLAEVALHAILDLHALVGPLGLTIDVSEAPEGWVPADGRVIERPPRP